MIKYETQLGDKVLNMEAREQRDVYKRLLRGMHCRKCSIDTIISFKKNAYDYLTPQINACCPEFEERVRDKLFEEN